MANFLESLLPTVVGAGLAATGIGAPLAAALVGGAQYARTGSLDKGLMAGLGAYGGAGLTEGLATAGADKAAEAAAANAVPASPLPGLGGGPVPAAAPAIPASPLPGLGGGAIPAATPAGLPASVANPSQFAMTAPSVSVANPVAAPVSIADKISAGAGQVTQSPGAFGNYLAANKYPALATAGSVAAGLGAFDAPKPPKEEAYIRPYTYDAGFTGGVGGPSGGQSAYTGERMWFQPTYTAQEPYRVASGGLLALAEGGDTRASRGYYKPPQKPDKPVPPAPAAPTPPPVRAPIVQAPAPIPVPAGFAPQMSGQSREALAYLMGKLPATPVSPAPALQAPVTSSTSMPQAGTWSYDPATGGFTKSEPPPVYRGGNSFYDRFIRNTNREASNRRPIVGRFAEGGSAGLENGGFVVPADVVSALGNGSSSAGLEVLAKKLGAKPIHGPGDGMSDSIPTSIEGKRRAAVARDEAYVPRAQVKQAGGADKLYKMMENVRKKAHGKPSQQRKLHKPDKLVP